MTASVKKTGSVWDVKDNEEESKRLEDIRNDKGSIETKNEVRELLAEIPGLNKNMDDQSKKVKGGFSCCFKYRDLKNQKAESHQIIAEIFGARELEGNLNLENVIKYNSFCRIDAEIAEKNKIVKELFYMEIFNGAISILGPFVFWALLKHDDWVCVTSRYYLGIKSAQFLVKLLICCFLKSKVYSKTKLTVDRGTLCRAKLQLILDTLLEIAAFSLICLLRYQIYQVELCLTANEADDTESGVWGDCQERAT